MPLTPEEESELDGMLQALESQAVARRRFTWVRIVGGVILVGMGVYLLLLTRGFPLLASRVEADSTLSKAEGYMIVYDVLLELGVWGFGMFATAYVLFCH